VQRLYLALEPGYQFVVDHLVSLALWEDKSISLGLCLVGLTTSLKRQLADGRSLQGYWVLWVYNLLFPSFIFYLLYVLLRRRIYPYPSLSQLREHRGHIDKASEFGEELQGSLTATSSFGLLDAWKALRVYNNNKNKVRKANEKMKQFEDTASVVSVEAATTDGDITAAEDSAEKVHEQDIKALGLEALCELIDGLERLKKYAAR
jgi:GRAM domain-containing protein 4